MAGRATDEPTVFQRTVLRAKSALRTGCNAVGLDISRYRPRNGFSHQRLRLLQAEQVDVVLDVGANRGQYARLVRSQGFHGRVISFEPVAAAFAELSRRASGASDWECHRLALGDVDADRKIHVSQNLASSSFLSLADSFVDAAPGLRYVDEETVPTARLDTLRPHIVSERETVFVKLDVQGFELEVLKGAEDMLRQTVGLECELSLARVYEGQPLFADAISFLATRGFNLCAIAPVFVSADGELLQVDGLFTRHRPKASEGPKDG